VAATTTPLLSRLLEWVRPMIRNRITPFLDQMPIKKHGLREYGCTMRDAGLVKAIKAAGGVASLARGIGVGAGEVDLNWPSNNSCDIRKGVDRVNRTVI
jgi:hypothetical protein